MANPTLVQSRREHSDPSLLSHSITYNRLNTIRTDPILNESIVTVVILDELTIHLQMPVLQCHHTICTDIEAMQVRPEFSDGQEIHFEHFVAENGQRRQFLALPSEKNQRIGLGSKEIVIAHCWFSDTIDHVETFQRRSIVHREITEKIDIQR